MKSIPASIKTYLVVFIYLLICHAGFAQKTGRYDAVYSGTPWFDDRGKVVNAHGANIMKDKGKYYLFGEAHSDTSNAFSGFSCYSSTDLYNWKFESIALPVQQSGRLGPSRVGERPKVMKCPKTGEYIMLMHTDSLGYKDPCVGYATSSTPTGPYIFRGPILFNGNPIKKWDMGSFQDNDGLGYLLVHGGNIFKLSDDYKSISEQVLKDMSPECESPAVFKKGNLYYFLASNRTSWECNDNFYYTATSLKGPWTSRGNFAPQGTLTWGSQTTFVLPIAGVKDTTYLYMGDRWSYPRQGSAATYVWQPLSVSGLSLSIPKYRDAWQVNLSTGLTSTKSDPQKIIAGTDKKAIAYQGNWEQETTAGSALINKAEAKGASFTVKFNGTHIGLYITAGPKNGYADVVLRDTKGSILVSSTIDMYCKYPASLLKFITPELTKGNYTLTVTALGDHAKWSDKRKNDYGSIGNFIALDKLVVYQ